MHKSALVFFSFILLTLHTFADPKSNADIPDVPAFGAAERAACVRPKPLHGKIARPYLASWKKAGFKNVQVTVMDQKQLCTIPQSVKFTHQLKINVVAFHDSQWTAELVSHRILRTSEIYAQCGVKLTQAMIFWTDPYKGISEIEGADAGPESVNSKIAQATPIVERPLLFYVRSRLDGGIAHALPEFAISGKSPLLNTIWITSEVESRAYRYAHDPRYSTDAHELGHILLNSSHYLGPEKNFLSAEIDGGNDQINLQQCEGIRKSSLLTPIK